MIVQNVDVLLVVAAKRVNVSVKGRKKCLCRFMQEFFAFFIM